MAYDDEGTSPRKGKLSAFTLLTSWLFNKRAEPTAQAETEFLNTRDGYELAKFAQKAFGGHDAEAKRAHEEAVAAEQAEIDALLAGTNSVPILHQQPADAVAAPPPAAPLPPPQVAPPPPPAPQAPAVPEKKQVEMAVKYLEKLREQGFSVETLAEALIIIESRDVRSRGG